MKASISSLGTQAVTPDDAHFVGAHYDGPLHSIGADDNASGVVALLELARRLSHSPPKRPVWLVAFDQEEWGLLGARYRRVSTDRQP